MALGVTGAVMLGSGAGAAHADAEKKPQEASVGSAEPSSSTRSADNKSSERVSNQSGGSTAGATSSARRYYSDEADNTASEDRAEKEDSAHNEVNSRELDDGEESSTGRESDGDIELETSSAEFYDDDSVQRISEPPLSEPESERSFVEFEREDEPTETPETLTAETTDPEESSGTFARSAEPADRYDTALDERAQLDDGETLAAASDAHPIQIAEVTVSAATSVISLTAAATPAPSPAPQNSFSEMLASLWRERNRIFNNTAPVLRSKQVTIELADSADASTPISLDGVDADGDVLTYSVAIPGSATGPKYGTVTIDQTTGTFVYDPREDLTFETITDTFTVTVSDNGSPVIGLIGFLKMLSGRTATATFTVVVRPANAAPVAVHDTQSGIANTTVTGNVLANDTDREGDSLTAMLVSNPEHGALLFSEDGSFTYTPDEGFTGKDAFTYVAWDGTTTSAPSKVTISVSAILDPRTPTIGVQGLSWWLGLSEADTNRALDMAKSAGLSAVRIDISWYVVEYVEGTYDWSGIDPLVNKIATRDMDVLGMLYDTPSWLSGKQDPHAAPNKPELFARFAADTALHYSGQIDSWEIWNEQNIPRFWAIPNPEAYAALLQAVYPAIKAVDPDATVITGGLSPDGSGIDSVQFITRMYQAGAGGYFDAVALHPYSFPQLPSLDSVTAVHDVMTAYGDGAKKIWLTEVGAPTGTSPFAVSEEVQAQSIAMFIDWAWTTEYVGPVYLYSLLDTGSNRSDPEDNFGLIRRDFTPKPAFGVWL